MPESIYGPYQHPDGSNAWVVERRVEDVAVAAAAFQGEDAERDARDYVAWLTRKRLRIVPSGSYPAGA